MRKFFGSIGSVSRITVESQALKSNILGDPSVRVVDVHVSASPAAAFPTRIGSASARTCRNASTG
jgi:hypothetical protein